MIAPYIDWWLHKRVRSTYEPSAEFKLVTKVMWVGPPSGVYGDVWLTFDDGTEMPVRTHHPDQFRPYKKDIEVQMTSTNNARDKDEDNA